MRRTTLAVLLVAIVLSLLLTYPLALQPAAAVEDRQDALLNVWITAWDGHQLLADPLHLYDANIFYPYPRTLAYSELLLGNALLALPLTAASGNPVLGYNVTLLSSFVLAAFGTYLLVLRLTRSPAAGLVAGLAFAFSSYRLTNLAQAQLLTAQWMPFALLALYGLLRRPGPRPAAALVLFFWMQAVSSFYYALLLALALAGLAVFEGVAALRRRPVGPDGAGGRRGRALVALFLAAGCCLLSLLPFALPYFQVQRELGFERSLAESEPFSASLRQYIMVPPNSVLHGRWLPSDATPVAGGYPVDALFPGLAVLALAAWGLLRGRGLRRWSFALLFLAALILSLGPRLYLAPGQLAGPELPLPYAWLYAVVPGFKALRAPVRFDALVSLALAVLAGYGLAAAARGLRRRPLVLLAAGCALLVVVESAAWPAARLEPVPVGEAVPPLARWLAAEAPQGPILELPMAFTPGGPQLDYQYLSTYHWRPTPDGYSGFVPPAHGQIVYEMERFPGERAVSLLQALGVRLVVVHGGRLAPERLAEVQAALPAAAELAPIAAPDAAGSGPASAPDLVYAVALRAFDPSALQVSVYFPPQAQAGRPYTAYLLALNPGPRSFALAPTAAVRPTFAWQQGGETAGEGKAVVAALPLVTSPGGAAVVALTVEAPPGAGTFWLEMGEEGGALGTWQAAAEVKLGEVVSLDLPVPARLEAWQHPAEAPAGGELPVRLTWRALGKIDAYYSIYLKLLDEQGKNLAGWDGEPGGGRAPTLQWLPGETVDDRIDLAIPADTVPGEYRLVAGMYRAADLARCLTLDAAGRPTAEILLGTVRVGP